MLVTDSPGSPDSVVQLAISISGVTHLGADIPGKAISTSSAQAIPILNVVQLNELFYHISAQSFNDNRAQRELKIEG